ncbi:DcaP family trimeric outer membrane transporter, partial [Vogesella mureinivorans]|uniref:DcaP family trimeric outer membrane transporter n=1 Tax=Vogesella mureinivorans TaxID=657276 RepID=UPI001F0EDC7F
TAKTTRIGLDFNTPVGDAKVGGKVEVDFAGNGVNENLRIRHAYLTYNNWLFGQTTSNFLSSHAPEMIDFATNLGGSYMAEAFRAGLQSVVQGQIDSGESIGLNRVQVFQYVVFPQALSVSI